MPDSYSPPIIAVLCIGLFSIAVGLDEIANPRVRNRVPVATATGSIGSGA